MIERICKAGQVAWAGVGLAVLLALLVLVAWTVRVIYPPLILAGAIVFLLNPVVSFLQRRSVPRAAGAGIAYLGVIATLVVAVLALKPLAGDQVDQLQDEWPEVRAKIDDFVDNVAEDLEGTAFEFTRQELYDSLSTANLTLGEQVERARDVGVRVFHVLLILVLGPIVGFYLLVDLPHIRRSAESLVPERARPEVLVVARRLNRAIGGFFRGQLLVALIVGVMCSIGLALIGLPFWLLIGMIAGLFNVIPLIGPWIGGVPAVVIALTTNGVSQALLVVAVMAGAQQVDNHFITPQVMQRAVKLHPAAVILALLAGGTLFGFLGLLLAVPAAAVLKILVGHLWRVHVLGEPVEEAAASTQREDARSGGMVKDVVNLTPAAGGADPAAAPDAQDAPVASGADGAGPDAGDAHDSPVSAGPAPGPEPEAGSAPYADRR